MTHGDQAKAKTAKGSHASASQKSSKAGKAVTGKEGRQAGKAAKAPVKKQQARPEKSVPAGASKKGGGSPVKEAAADTKGKGRPAPSSDNGTGFSNPAVAAAFKRAVKKYPNALRKLTD